MAAIDFQYLLLVTVLPACYCLGFSGLYAVDLSNDQFTCFQNEKQTHVLWFLHCLCTECCSETVEAVSPPICEPLLYPVQMLPMKGSFPCLQFTSLTGGSACGKSLKDSPVQESAVPQKQWKHCEERPGAGGFLSSQMWLSIQALLSKPSIIWPEVGAFAVQEHYSEICHSSC